MDLKELGITKEDILNKLADRILLKEQQEGEYGERSYYDIDDYRAYAKQLIEKHVDDKAKKAVDEAIEEVTAKAMSDIITPRDIWGRITGETTSIAEQIIEKTREYWEAKVDTQGKLIKGYCSSPKTRAQFMLQQQINDVFDYAIKNNMSAVIKETKEALLEGYNTEFKELVDKFVSKKR